MASAAPHGFTIDLSDKDAWDDTVLIRAYDRAVYNYLRCNSLTALARASVLFHELIFNPMRCLAGKAKELNNWSVISMNELLDTTAEVLGSVAADGAALFDLRVGEPFVCDFSPARFAALADKLLSTPVEARHDAGGLPCSTGP